MFYTENEKLYCPRLKCQTEVTDNATRCPGCGLTFNVFDSQDMPRKTEQND
jgi:hypothetical protein